MDIFLLVGAGNLGPFVGNLASSGNLGRMLPGNTPREGHQREKKTELFTENMVGTEPQEIWTVTPALGNQNAPEKKTETLESNIVVKGQHKQSILVAFIP